MSDLSVYAISPLGSVPLHGLAPVGKISFSTTFGVAGGCGLDALSFSMTLPRGFSNQLLVQGTVLELRIGSTPLGRASLTTIDFETGAVSATGLFKRGVDFIAFESLTTRAGTLNPRTGLQNAITEGLEWRVDASTLAALDVTLATTGTAANLDAATWYSMADLLDAFCTQQGANVFWGVDAGGFLRIYQTPTAASYMLSPSVPAMDSTTTDYVTDLVCRYSDINKPVGDGVTFYASAVMATVPVRVGSTRKQATEDITSHGPLTAAQAQEIADLTLAAKSPTLTYNGGVDATPGDVRTIDGGYSAPLWRVVAEAGAGTRLRHHGWRNMQGALMPGFAQEWVIGKASYSDAGAVNLSPTADAAKTIGQTLSSTAAAVAEVGKVVERTNATLAVGALHAELAVAQQDLAQAQSDIDAAAAQAEQAAGDSATALDAAQSALLTAGNAANLAETATVYSKTDPGHFPDGVPGRVWMQLDDAGHVVGIERSDGYGWEPYLLAAGQVIVPSSIGGILLADGAVTAPKVQANSITTEKLTIADFSNMLNDGGFEKSTTAAPIGCTLPTGATIATITGAPVGGTKAAQVLGAGAARTLAFDVIPVVPGDTWYAETYVRKTTTGVVGTFTFNAAFAKDGGAKTPVNFTNSRSDAPFSLALGASLGALPISGLTQNTWYRIGGQVVVPAGVNQMVVQVQADATIPAGQTLQWDNVAVRKATSGELIVDGSVKATSLAATLNVTGKNFIGGTFTGQTFLGAEFKTDTAGRRMEIGHNQSGSTDPANITFYNGWTGETAGLIGPFGGEPAAGSLKPSLAIVAPYQASAPYKTEIDLHSGSDATTTNKADGATGWGTQPNIELSGNVKTYGDIRTTGGVLVAGRVQQGTDTAAMVILTMGTGIGGYGSPFGWPAYTRTGRSVQVSGIVKCTGALSVGSWLVSGLPAPADGTTELFPQFVQGAFGGVNLQLVSGTWCLVTATAVPANGYINFSGINYITT